MARVIPYRFDVEERALEGPLAQFQAVGADKEGTLKLLRSLNNALEKPRLGTDLEAAFDAFWPRLDARFKEIREEAKKEGAAPPVPTRDDRAVLDEVLAIVRELRKAPTYPYTGIAGMRPVLAPGGGRGIAGSVPYGSVNPRYARALEDTLLDRMGIDPGSANDQQRQQVRNELAGHKALSLLDVLAVRDVPEEDDGKKEE